MALSKNEIELEKLRLRAHTHGRYIDLVKHVVQLGAGLGLAWLFFNCIIELTAANPERLKALATVITSMGLERIAPWILAGGCGVAWAAERSGKKRLIKKMANQRHQIERNDPYAASSGLNETGDTPTVEE